MQRYKLHGFVPLADGECCQICDAKLYLLSYTLFRVLAQHNIIHDPGSFTCIREDYEETTLISSGTCYYHRRNLLRIEMLLFVSQVNPFTTDPLFNVVASLDPSIPMPLFNITRSTYNLCLCGQRNSNFCHQNANFSVIWFQSLESWLLWLARKDTAIVKA